MKATKEFQEQFREHQFFNDKILNGISKNAKLNDSKSITYSSAAACLNVLGCLNQHQDRIIPFFKTFGIEIEEVLKFPTGVNYDGEIYDDDGPIVFEWIGPKNSPINEIGGSRGKLKTSIDAFLLCKINNKTTQIFIEWKFCEDYLDKKYSDWEDHLHKFGGKKGIERIRRYSSVLTSIRKNYFPFNFKEEDSIGLQDFSYEPYYQLLRMTLLAKATTPSNLGGIEIEDYIILHLTHSENEKLLTVTPEQLKYCPGIQKDQPQDFYKLWISLLSDEEKTHFKYGYWNKSLQELKDESKYFEKRYQ